MKKLLTYFSLIVAIASFGGLIATANAQAISPQEATQLQATLNSVSAELAALQAQANTQANGGATAPAAVTTPTVMTTLSPADAAAVNTALSSLVSALSGLETAIAQNPQVATTNAQGISVALQGIGKTLLAITTTINGGTVASGPALAQNSTGAAGASGNGSIAAANPPSPSTAGAGSGIAPSTASNGNSAPAVNAAPTATPAAAPQTAQVASAFSLKNIRWPYVVAGILVILAVALWLFWPGEGEDNDKKNVVKKSGGNPAPAKPAPAAQSPQMTILASSGKSVIPPQQMPQTPLASAVSAPAQRNDAANVPKIVPSQPAQQQRKPA
ncbi:MAG TPA: hypothetical protein VHZ04_02305 [Candidatus Paceibacterota bacterium]|jgi:hypothetical protein|nr:hypothetical protein [Candidatus Paceibacterota bacterium]